MKSKITDWSDDQKACIETLAEFARGHHHLPPVREFGRGVCINYFGDLSTFDADRLTTLVLLAHRDAVRIEIGNSGPRRVKIIAHKRKHDDSLRFHERHPNLAHLSKRIAKYEQPTPADNGNAE